MLCHLDLFLILFCVCISVSFLCLYLCSFYLYLVSDLIINKINTNSNIYTNGYFPGEPYFGILSLSTEW